MATPHMRKMMSARTALLLDSPFFGVLALQLVLVERSDIRTMATDGVHLFFSPTFMDTLTRDEIIGVVAHEVLHCAAGHCWRKDGRDHTRWNVACDYAINSIIIDAGMTLPKGRLHDAQWAGKSAEYIYARLPQDNDQQQAAAGADDGNDDASGDNACGCGEVLDAPATDDAGDAAATESDWKQIAAQAVQAAKMRGKLPANLAREFGTLVAPLVDWRSLLRRFVTETTTSDYSWSQPNRRYLCSGLYLPQLHAHACGPIAVAIDTSGSIDDETLRQFASEVNAIAQDVQPSRVDILWCDARVHRVDSFDRGDAITFKPIGGGGTAFAPVFAHYERHADLTLACLIYLTDLQGSFPSDAPEYPVLWACTYANGTAPFGEVVPCLT